MVSWNPTHGRDCAKSPAIPPTAVGGLFKPAYKESAGRSPFCYLSPLAGRGERKRGKTGILGAPFCRLGLNHPPTSETVRKLRNTPHGSVGIVQVRPTRRTGRGSLFPLLPLAARGEGRREKREV